MNQLPLFRLDDPPTSRDAADHIAPKLNRLQRCMLQAFSLRPRTANEAAAWCVERHGGIHESYRKRVGELRRQGMIRVVASRECEHTGCRADVWEVNRAS